MVVLLLRALRWRLAGSLAVLVVAAALIGASRPEQVVENVKAAGVTIPAELLSRIDGVLGDAVISDPSRTAATAPQKRPS